MVVGFLPTKMALKIVIIRGKDPRGPSILFHTELTKREPFDKCSQPLSEGPVPFATLAFFAASLAQDLSLLRVHSLAKPTCNC